jgi:serine phosphatase RsbU (regulator of sigma subunit)
VDEESDRGGPSGGQRAPEPVPDRPGDLLGALTSLLWGTHLIPPERIPAAVQAAAACLGLRAVVYVVDYGGSLLVPMPEVPASAGRSSGSAESGATREPLSTEGTVAGRAYRSLELVTSTSDGRPHLWVPIIDGIERVGVLDLVAPHAADLEDAALRRSCWSLSHYLGHLITVLDAYGDGLDHLRRRRPRNTEAELVWNLLPPLTAGTDSVIVSGRLEPAYEVGGDVFDYALSPTTARFAVLDATGHDLSAGLAAAAALAAYRNARRNGRGLFEQAESVHRTLEKQFRGDVYASGVFGDLDTGSGRLRYLTAGHANPLVLRDGRIVKQLAGGRRPLLGLQLNTGVTVGEEHLEPDDTVVLYTDGFTEARDADGRAFGLERLIGLLELETAEDVPLPEVVDRLVRAVLRHQNDVLQDDATIVLLQWTTEAQAALEPWPPG